jgi:hypothetical protein
MAQQETEAKQEPAAPDGTGQEGTGKESAAQDSGTQDSGAQEASGRHAATDDATEQTGEKAAPAEASTEESAPAEKPTEKSAPAEKPTEKSAPAERSTEKAAPAEAPTEKTQAQASGQRKADTSWAEPEPADTPHHRSLDVGELAWRTGNVLATVVRTLALLFALVLVVNVVLVLVGVNPANGVAQFVATVANIVILGFRDLFVPANPVVMLIVNSLIAAIFWVFVGELVSRLIRFLAARVR